MCLSPRVLSVIATISEEEASSQKTNDAQSTSHGKTDFEERMRKRNAIAYMKQKENGKRRKYQDARNLKNRDKMVRSALVEEMHLYPAVMAKVKMLPVRGSKLNGAPLYEFIDEARKDWEKRKSCEIRKGAIDNVANLQDTGTNTSACDVSISSSISQTVSPPHTAATVGKSADFGPASNCAGRSSVDAAAVAASAGAALITPHKPQEDVPETEHAEDNGNYFTNDDENIDDNDMHCFDDDDRDDMGVEVSDRTLGASPDQSDEGNIVEEGLVNSTKPAASTTISTPPTSTTKASDGQSFEGKVGLVLIPLKSATDQIVSFTTSTKYMYWPALIYSSYEAFESTFPLDQNTRQFYATVSRERMLHETHEIAKWTQLGIVPSGHPLPVQVAILFGSNVPPCGTRSYPIYPTDITIVRGGVPQMPQVALKTNGFKEISEYANNPKFQEAVQSAKKYKTTKDTKMFASLQLLWR